MSKVKIALILGVLMLVLAALAAYELTKKPQLASAPSAGQMITGSLSQPLISEPDEQRTPSSQPSAVIAQSSEPMPILPAPRVASTTPSVEASSVATDAKDAKDSQDDPQPATAQKPSATAPRNEQPLTAAQDSSSTQQHATSAPQNKPTPQAAPAPQSTPAAEASQAVTSEKTINEPQKTAPQAVSQRVITTGAPEKTEKDERPIIATTTELSDKSFIFRISAAEALAGKAFFLPSPARFVIDLDGFWSIKLPKLPSNSFVKGFRLARQGSSTRLVMDLTKEHSCQMARINPTTLEFRIR